MSEPIDLGVSDETLAQVQDVQRFLEALPPDLLHQTFAMAAGLLALLSEQPLEEYLRSEAETVVQARAEQAAVAERLGLDQGELRQAVHTAAERGRWRRRGHGPRLN